LQQALTEIHWLLPKTAPQQSFDLYKKKQQKKHAEHPSVESRIDIVLLYGVTGLQEK
jgi:hypothetical protein